MWSFESHQLYYRPLETNDIELYTSLYTDSKTMKDIGEPLSYAGAESAFEKQLSRNNSYDYLLSIRLKKNNEKVGLVGVSLLDKDECKVNLGIMVLKKFHRKGYPLEALTALIDNHREQLPQTIFSTEIMERNFPAKRLMTKLGFRQTEQTEDKCFWELR